MAQVSWQVSSTCESGACVMVAESGSEVLMGSETAAYRKSSTCDSGACVEVGALGDDLVRFRPADGEPAVLTVTRDAFAALIADIKAGKYDDFGEGEEMDG
jgi:hypothetical protein